MSSVAFPTACIGKTRIGWIGCGVMGQRMASRLLKKGYSMTVYNRTMEKCQHLISLGAQSAASPREVAEASDVVFTIVGYPKDVREVILDKEKGVVKGLKKGGIVVDMTTSDPYLAKEIEEVCVSEGKGCLDAPVSGGDSGAASGTLAIFCGGRSEVFTAIHPLLMCMGREEVIVHCGGAGAGQHTKLTNQIVIAGNTAGYCEALLYAKKVGLDINKTLQAISGGAANSWGLTHLAPRVARRDFQPNFYADHFTKDLKCALDVASDTPFSLPSCGTVYQLFKALQAQGDGDAGLHGLYLALERLNGEEQQPFDKTPLSSKPPK